LTIDDSDFVLGENKKLLLTAHFVFLQQLVSTENAVAPQRNLTGDGDGDDECIKIGFIENQPKRNRIACCYNT
jgi:stress response protein SCP2